MTDEVVIKVNEIAIAVQPSATDIANEKIRSTECAQNGTMCAKVTEV